MALDNRFVFRMVGDVETNEDPMNNEEKILGIINNNYSALGMLSPDMRDELSRKTFIETQLWQKVRFLCMCARMRI